VGPHYFDTMRIPILRGRAFNDRDTPESPMVAVVNETLVERFWPGDDPVGKRIRIEGEENDYQVVGVARDGKYRTLGESPRPFVYRALRQGGTRDRTVLVRTSGDTQAILAALRSEIRQLDEKLPVVSLHTLEEATGVSLLLPRAGAALFGLFGVLGLVLAAVGLYGVLAYTVSQRTHEIGIRMALGAQQDNILKLVIGRGLRLTLIGLVVGLSAAAALTRTISVLLYGISPTDTATFGAVSVILLAVAITACFVPAWRAAHVDPVVALRHE
jgi:predicted permease